MIVLAIYLVGAWAAALAALAVSGLLYLVVRLSRRHRR